MLKLITKTLTIVFGYAPHYSLHAILPNVMLTGFYVFANTNLTQGKFQFNLFQLFLAGEFSVQPKERVPVRRALGPHGRASGFRGSYSFRCLDRSTYETYCNCFENKSIYATYLFEPQFRPFVAISLSRSE